MHPINFGFNKNLRRPCSFNRSELSHLEALSPRQTICVCLDIGHPGYDQLTAVRQGIRLVVSHDSIVS